MGSVQSFSTQGVYIVPNSADYEKGLVYIKLLQRRDRFIVIMNVLII